MFLFRSSRDRVPMQMLPIAVHVTELIQCLSTVEEFIMEEMY
jgi:hypothetical protein